MIHLYCCGPATQEKVPNYRNWFLHRFILPEKRALFKKMWSPEGAHTHIKPHEFSIIPASAGDTPASAGDIPASPGDTPARAGDTPASAGDEEKVTQSLISICQIWMEQL